MTAEWHDLDRPEGDDKRRKHWYDAGTAGWRIAPGWVSDAGLTPIPPDLWNGVITPERRVELDGYPEESE